MIESDVAEVLNEVNLISKLAFQVGGQNNVHPMDKMFGLIEKVNDINLGTATQTLTSRDGIWVQQQTKAYQVRISVQGEKARNLNGDTPEDVCERLQLMMNTPPLRQMFMDAGYTYKIEDNMICIPMFLNTDQYVRYSFVVSFRTSKAVKFAQDAMKAVEVKGKFTQGGGAVQSEYEESIEKGTK